MACTFLTRLPVPKTFQQLSPDGLRHANRYFPLVGGVVGTIAASLFMSLQHFLFEKEIAIILSMIATILITGGLHEDGLADSCDAFGGGSTKAQILTIMKDSRIGSFGALALILGTLLKFFSLKSLSTEMIVKSLILSHCWARFFCCLFIYFCDYVREDANSKSKAVAEKMAVKDLLVGGSTSLLLAAIVLFPYWKIILFLIVLLISIWTLLLLYLKKRIGGYTGDALGASEQIFETAIYLFFGSSLWNFF